MPRPRGGDWLDDELAALRGAGVDVLVCLLTTAERAELGLLDEQAAAIRAGLEFHLLPIADLGVPDPVRAAPLLDLLRDRLDGGRHVAVHCRAGIGRASLIAAACLVRIGVPADEAWQLIATARGCPVPETEEQRRWLDQPGSG
ncbi:tyrosine protein phosphatase [Polymorphospora rubra]